MCLSWRACWSPEAHRHQPAATAVGHLEAQLRSCHPPPPRDCRSCGAWWPSGLWRVACVCAGAGCAYEQGCVAAAVGRWRSAAVAASCSPAFGCSGPGNAHRCGAHTCGYPQRWRWLAKAGRQHSLALWVNAVRGSQQWCRASVQDVRVRALDASRDCHCSCLPGLPGLLICPPLPAGAAPPRAARAMKTANGGCLKNEVYHPAPAFGFLPAGALERECSVGQGPRGG